MNLPESTTYGFMRSQEGEPTHFFKIISDIEADAIRDYRERYDKLAARGRAPQIQHVEQVAKGQHRIIMDIFPGVSLDRLPKNMAKVIYTPHFAKDMALLMEDLHDVRLDPTDNNPGNFFYDPVRGTVGTVLDDLLPATHPEDQTLDYFIQTYARTMLGVFLDFEPEVRLTEMAATKHNQLLKLMPNTKDAYQMAGEALSTIIEFCHEPLTNILRQKKRLTNIHPEVLTFALDGLTTNKRPKDFTRIYQLSE